MYLKTQGIVLNSYNYSNFDKLYKIYTLNEGNIPVIAKGIRNIKSRRSSQLDTLNILDLTLYKKDQFYYLSSSSLIEDFSSIKSSLSTSSWAFFILEIISLINEDYDSNEYLYNLTKKVLYKININPSKRIVYRYLRDLIANQGYWDIDYVNKHPYLTQIDGANKVDLLDQSLIDKFFLKKIEEIVDRKINSSLLISSF